MSTTLLIGRWPAAVRRCLSHSGDGPIFTSSNTRAVKRRQISGSMSTLQWSSARSLPAGLGVGVGRVDRQRVAGDGVHLARDAVDAEAVGTVRRDLELQHLVGDRQVLGQRVARLGRRSRRSTMISAWSSEMPTSSSARIIPLDSHAAQLRLARAGCRRA